MKKFSIRLKEMYAEAEARLSTLIDENGTESKHSSNKSLKIKKDDLKYNLSGGRYLTEIKKVSKFTDEIELVDNGGYTYNCSVMDSDNFFEVVDYLFETY